MKPFSPITNFFLRAKFRQSLLDQLTFPEDSKTNVKRWRETKSVRERETALFLSFFFFGLKLKNVNTVSTCGKKTMIVGGWTY